MLRKNFSRKIEIDTILKYLELITKFVAVMIIIATVIGGLNIHSYLKDINHLFLFSDVVGISYASISALVSYFLFVFMVSLGFLSPFIIPVFIFLISSDNNKNNNPANKTTNKNPQSVFNPSQKLLGFSKKAKELLLYPALYTTPIFMAVGVAVLPITIVILLICYLPIYILNFLVRELFFGKERGLSFIVLSKFVHWVLFLCVIGTTLIVFFGNSFSEYLLYGPTLFFSIVSFLYTIQFIKNNHNQKELTFENIIFTALLSIILAFSSMLYFLFVVYPTINIVKYEIVFILFYFLSVLLFGFFCFLSHSVICDYFQKKTYDYTEKHNMKLIVAGFAFVFVYTLYLSYFSDYNISLYATRFIERPTNASWYLIHNGNTTSETINGMTKDDIKYRQQSFIPNGWQQYCKDDVWDRMNMRHCPTLKNDNALYGYMAWNLGKAKVFCPQSVDFFKTDDKKQRNAMSQACMQIDGNLLQPIGADYL